MIKSEQVERVREVLRRFNRRAGVLQTDPYGLDLSLSQGSALVDIGRFGQLRSQDLVQLLNLEKSSVSRLVANLEERKLLKITPDPEDGRSKHLSLTPSGRKAVAVINRLANRVVEEAFDHLSAKEQAEVVAALEKLNHAVNRADEG